MRDNKKVCRRAERILEIAQQMASGLTCQVSNRLEEIELHYSGYGEPGYEDKVGVVATGNWNDITSWDNKTNTRTQISDLLCRVLALFEKMGIECEWSDEWMTCECGKLVRTQADSYCWTSSLHISEDGNVSCIDCLKDNPSDYLREIEDNPKIANTMNCIDPSDHGYVKVNEDSYATGWYPGQHDDPSRVAEDLREKGITRFLFHIDAVGQFDANWSVYVHKDEEVLLNCSATCDCDDCCDCADSDDCDDYCSDDDAEVSPNQCEYVREEYSDHNGTVMRVTKVENTVLVNKNDCECKCCRAKLNRGETPCWKCGLSNPTE